MAMKRVRATVATNAPLEIYGGLQLGDELLDGLAAALRAGDLPFTFNHDAQRPVRTANFDAGVEPGPNGSKQVWATFDIDDADWDYVSAEFERHGVGGGISWSMTANPRRLGGPAQAQPALTIAADAGYFHQEDLAGLARDLAATTPLELREIYQFAAVPPPLVVVEIQQQSDLWHDLLVGGSASLAATMLFEFLKSLLRPRHRFEEQDSEPRTSFDFKLEEPGRTLEFHLRTDDSTALRDALDKLPAASALEQPAMSYDEESHEWVPPN